MKYSEVFEMNCNNCDGPLPMIHRFDYEEIGDGKMGMSHPCCGHFSYWHHFIVQRGQPI